MFEIIRKSSDIIEPMHTRQTYEDGGVKVEAWWLWELKIPGTNIVTDSTGWFKNVICDTNGKLLAALNKEEVGYGGIQYLAVGIGNPVWDSTSTPSPSAGTTALVSELARKAVTIGYLDTNNDDTGSVTNRLKVYTDFTTSEANGAHREFGLFGGTATGTANTGLMVNYRTQLVKNKTSADDLTITVRLIYT